MKVSTVLLSGACLIAAATAGASDTTTDKDKAVILAKLESIEKAWHDLNPDAAMAPYIHSDRLQVFDAPPPLEVMGYEHSLTTTKDVMAAVTGAVQTKYSNIKIVVDHNHAYGAYFVSMLGQLKNGKTMDLMLRITDVWERQKNGDWLIVHEQNSVPFDFETGKAYLHATEGGRAVPFTNPALAPSTKPNNP